MKLGSGLNAKMSYLRKTATVFKPTINMTMGSFQYIALPFVAIPTWSVTQHTLYEHRYSST